MISVLLVNIIQIKQLVGSDERRLPQDIGEKVVEDNREIYGMFMNEL
jgi:hypothetical protein